MGNIVEFLKKSQKYIGWIVALVASLLLFFDENPFPQGDEGGGDQDSTVVVPK